MDFGFTDEQQAISALAGQATGDSADPAKLLEFEQSGDELRLHRPLWSALAGAGLLGLAVPEEFGGAGLGSLECALVLDQIGRYAAPVPALGAAIERGNAYAEAGADVIFVEAPRTVEEIALVGREISAPKLINVVAGGLTPEVDPAMLRELGYSIAIYPTTALLAVTNAAVTALRSIGGRDAGYFRFDGRTIVVSNPRIKIGVIISMHVCPPLLRLRPI